MYSGDWKFLHGALQFDMEKIFLIVANTTESPASCSRQPIFYKKRGFT